MRKQFASVAANNNGNNNINNNNNNRAVTQGGYTTQLVAHTKVQYTMHQSHIMYWYWILRTMTTILFLFVVIGIVGSTWISVDFPSVLGSSFLIGTIMLATGLLLGVWTDPNYAIVRSLHITRAVVDGLVIVFVAIYLAMQLDVILNKCPAPPDPVTQYNCTNAYSILVAAAVYAGIGVLIMILLLVVEIMMGRKVVLFGAWREGLRSEYGTNLIDIVENGMMTEMYNSHAATYV